jgi:hypothetical protein
VIIKKTKLSRLLRAVSPSAGKAIPFLLVGVLDLSPRIPAGTRGAHLIQRRDLFLTEGTQAEATEVSWNSASESLHDGFVGQKEGAR